MASGRTLVTGPSSGNETGSTFDDKPNEGNLKTTKITKISVWHSSYVHGLLVQFSNQAGIMRGGNLGVQADVFLAAEEYITKIQGGVDGGAVNRLTFTTNKGKTWGPYGSTGSIRFTFSAEGLAKADVSPSMGLLYFTGTCDSTYIRSLCPTFALYRGCQAPAPLVNYERHVPTDASTQTLVLSKFAQNLMSPVATLVVGPSNIEFRGYERTLCRLPFFAAALHGQFREASEKRITMPEDEPAIISALIEFLYTGRYTYTYTSSASTDPPASDLVEGAFHIGVYATASKYDCKELLKASVGAFTRVLKDLNGVELVRLWKTAYANGLSLEDVKDVAEVKSGMVPLLREVYKNHKEEMEKTVEEFPALASDFLRALVEEDM